MIKQKMPAIHPGIVLQDEFLKPMRLSQSGLARAIRIAPRHMSQIVAGKRRVNAATALRLAHFFGTSARFWLGLQTDYDLDVAADHWGHRLEREIKPYSRAVK